MSDSTSVQVVVRVRPFSEKENKGNTLPVVTASTEQKQVTVIRGAGNRQQRQTYAIDNVFSSFSTQKEVFEQTLEPVIADVLTGFECTMFAYGQTGTGKTHTMEGSLDNEQDRGIIPRSAQAIFERLKDPKNHYTESTVTAQYLEIYNEELADLLIEQGSRETKLQIVEDVGRDGKKGKGIYVQNLSEKVVNTAEDVHALMKMAQERRRIGETKMNKASSRSHCLFSLKVHAKKIVDSSGAVMECMGKLHMVDLAGSECAKTAGQEDPKVERERKNINQSLLTLGRVISALRDGNIQRIPYRDSKLTRLLQESLGGRCKTVIIATVSPSVLAVEETISTLNYAQAAHGIQNKPVATSYLKVGEGARPSTATGTNCAGASVQDWNQMECRLSYLQTELDEAQAALSRKHMEQQKIIDRAEAAEHARDELGGELASAQLAVEEQQVKVQKVAEKLQEQIWECERRESIIGARKRTEASLTGEAKELIATLKAGLAEGGRYHEALVAHAAEQERVRAEGTNVTHAVEVGLGALSQGLADAKGQVEEASRARAKEAASQSEAVKRTVEGMSQAIAELEGKVSEVGALRAGAAKAMGEAAGASLANEVARSDASSDELASVVAKAVEEIKGEVDSAVEGIRQGERALTGWADAAKGRIEACAAGLKETHAALSRQMEASKEEDCGAMDAVLQKLAVHLAALEEIGGEMDAQSAMQGGNVASLKALTSSGDDRAASLTGSLGKIGKSLAKSLAAQDKGQKDDEVAGGLESERAAAQARGEAAEMAMTLQRAELSRAVAEGTKGLAEEAACGLILDGEGALQAGSVEVLSKLAGQSELLKAAGAKLGETNAEAAVRKMGGDAREALGKHAEGAQGVVGRQLEGLSATEGRLEAQKGDEAGLRGLVASSHEDLVAKIAEQDRTMAAQAALLERQREQLDALLKQQHAAQQALVKAVMGSLESMLAQQVAVLSSTATAGVQECVESSSEATNLNSAARANAIELSDAALTSKLDAENRLALWGASRDAAISEVAELSIQNSNAASRVSALVADASGRQAELDAAAAAWGEANRAVGQQIDEADAASKQAAGALADFSEAVAERCVAARLSMAAWGEVQRTSYAVVAEQVAGSEALSIEVAAGVKVSGQALAKIEKKVASWGESDRKCHAAVTKVAEEVGALARDVDQDRFEARDGEEALQAAMEDATAKSGASRGRFAAQVEAGGEAFGGLQSARGTSEASWVRAGDAVARACEGVQCDLERESSSVDYVKGTRPAVLAALEGSAVMAAAALGQAEKEVVGLSAAQAGSWVRYADAARSKVANYVSEVAEAHSLLASEASEASSKAVDAAKEAVAGAEAAKEACRACGEDANAIVTKAAEAATLAANDAAVAVKAYAAEFVKAGEEVPAVEAREGLAFTEEFTSTPADEVILACFQPSAGSVDVDAIAAEAEVEQAADPAEEHEPVEAASEAVPEPVEEEQEEAKEAENAKLAVAKGVSNKVAGGVKYNKMMQPKARPGTLKPVN